MEGSPIGRTRVFISYSHTDAKYLDRLGVHLRPYIRTGKVDLWEGRRIATGTRWRAAIRLAIDSAKIAILLVSADYLASDFIANNELPRLLRAAEQEGLLIFSVIVSPCAFQESELEQYQTINRPSAPLSHLTEGQQEEVWVTLARYVTKALAPSLSDGKPRQAPPLGTASPEEPKKSLPSFSQTSRPKVFVSHSHKNDDFTARLVKDLRAAGVDVWVDMVNLQHGDFMTRINEALSASEWLVLVLTPEALISPAVQTEVNAAVNMVWSKELKGVIPFMAVPCESKSIPPIWKNLHRYDATKDYKQALAGLSRALGVENS